MRQDETILIEYADALEKIIKNESLASVFNAIMTALRLILEVGLDVRKNLWDIEDKIDEVIEEK